ncbi:MAG: sensor histidine kinase [Xanthomonadales bacterium]|nr:sensor histidine kinase [Xanthomonadales bacterium]
MAAASWTDLRLLRLAGVLTWACAGLPLLLDALLASGPIELRGAPLASGLSWLAFGLLFVAASRGIERGGAGAGRLALLMAAALAAIAVSHFSRSGLGSVLLMVLAGLLPWLLPLAAGLAWLAAQHLVLIPVFAAQPGFSAFEAVLQALLYVGFSAFVFVTSLVARRQAQARELQRRLNAELRATRALLAESSRLNERLRIARELHDVLGHRLTALSLHLETASHRVDGAARTQLLEAREIARGLLAEVRSVVSRMREGAAIDLRRALAALCEGVPGLAVEIDYPEALRLDDPELAFALLRCTQEAITNAIRHGGATRLRVALAREEDGSLRYRAEDDGRGAEAVRPGHGLTGMIERVRRLGGQLAIDTAPGRGFALSVSIPAERTLP